MDLMEGLLSRRSIRKYADKPVEKEVVAKLIKAAQHAPSAHNTQSWEFLVIDDKLALKEIRHIQRSASFAENAPLAVLVCGDETKAFSREKEGWTYIDIDCAAATQNLLLAAHALGLGGCWCGATPMTKPMAGLKEFFNLPDNIKPFSIVVLGYPDEESKLNSDRYDEARIHWGKW